MIKKISNGKKSPLGELEKISLKYLLFIKKYAKTYIKLIDRLITVVMKTLVLTNLIKDRKQKIDSNECQNTLVALLVLRSIRCSEWLWL